MKTIAIIWNSVQQFKSEMLKDLRKHCKIDEMFDLELDGSYDTFVRDVYESENMAAWKIDNKITAMSNRGNRTVTILYLDIDKGEVVFNDRKQKTVYLNLESTKDNMRNKYKEKIDGYYFDIVFHMADDEREYANCKAVVDKYLKKFPPQNCPE